MAIDKKLIDQLLTDYKKSEDREAIAAMDFFTVPTLTFGGSVLLLHHQP